MWMPRNLKLGPWFHNSSIDIDGGMRVAPHSPGVHNDLLGLLGVKGQVVVGTPCCQVLDHICLYHLIIPSDQACHCGVFCKPDYGVRIMYRNTVKGEEGVEKRAQHTALWHINVQGKNGGGEVV